MDVDYFSILSLLMTVMGLSVMYFKFILGVREDIATINATCINCTKVTDALPQLLSDVAKLTAANDVWWKVLGPRLGEIIHSPIHKRRDQLMDKWLDAHGDIPEYDLRELRGELAQMLEEADSGNNKGLRIAGAILLDRVESQISELEQKER